MLMYCLLLLFRLNCLIEKVDISDFSVNVSKCMLHVK